MIHLCIKLLELEDLKKRMLLRWGDKFRGAVLVLPDQDDVASQSGLFGAHPKRGVYPLTFLRGLIVKGTRRKYDHNVHVLNV